MPKGGGDKPTPMQKQAVDNVISGQFVRKNGKPNVSAAMRGAGYAESSVHKATETLGKAKGVQAYLKELGGEAMKRWNMSVQDKVMDVYLDGLDATRLFGKDAIEHPDHLTRKAFADRFSEFFGWVQSAQLPPGSHVQQLTSLGSMMRNARNLIVILINFWIVIIAEMLTLRI